jgi:hypothetical protein
MSWAECILHSGGRRFNFSFSVLLLFISLEFAE